MKLMKGAGHFHPELELPTTKNPSALMLIYETHSSTFRSW
ncbi:hypothetical protein SAMN05720354_1061 [Nitrosospira sp. Nsp1]|nr:hypothetical protein SAMN05720354_1061 [Nitrosospira sp. Nsp1]